jgi:formate/nitrite transporter
MCTDGRLRPSTRCSRRKWQLGVKKANTDAVAMFVLAILADAFIAFGAVFATTVISGEGLPYGVGRLLAGSVISLGLVLVVVGGAELFTSNTLMVMAWAGGRVSTRRLLRNWLIVYAGNFVGALGIAVLVFTSGQYPFGGGVVGATALATANTKLSFGLGQAVALGVLCNTLVCLGVWLAFSARSTADRLLAIVPPIAAFVPPRTPLRAEAPRARDWWRHRLRCVELQVGEGCTLITRTSGVLGPCNLPQPLWQRVGRTVT